MNSQGNVDGSENDRIDFDAQSPGSSTANNVSFRENMIHSTPLNSM